MLATRGSDRNARAPTHQTRETSSVCNRGTRKLTYKDPTRCERAWWTGIKNHYHGTHRCDRPNCHAQPCRCACGEEKNYDPKALAVGTPQKFW
jgi:hypothetical protein